MALIGTGASGPLLGLARFIMCAFEVPCFHVAGALHKRLGTFLLLALCQLAFVVRCGWYALLVDPLLVLPAEVLHGVTFAVTWSTALVFADRVAPAKGKASLIAVVEGAHWGLGSGCGALVGGHIYEKNGAVVLFQICAGLSAFSMLLALVAAFLGYMLWDSTHWRFSDRLTPLIGVSIAAFFWVIRVGTIVLSFFRPIQISSREAKIMDTGFQTGQDPREARLRFYQIFGFTVALMLVIWVFGFHFGATLMLGAYLVTIARFSWLWTAFIVGVAIAILVGFYDYVLGIPWHVPLIVELFK